MDKNNNTPHTKPTNENATPAKAKKSRSSKKDRSAGKYSEADFRNMPRDQQYELAKKYMNIASETFDKSGLFKFSSTHFNKICSELGFKKELITIDKRAEKKAAEGTILRISHGRRETERCNWTFSKGTSDKVDRILGPMPSTTEKSKLIDRILNDALDHLLEEKEAGRLWWDYERTETKKKL